MLARIIEWSINSKFFVILGTIAVVGFGGWAMVTTPVDAIPDLSDVQVIVQTEWRGQAPQVIEDQVTYPLSTELLKVPNTKYVRGISQFGRSFVYVVFEDDVDMYWARSRVLEYLNGIRDRMPEAVQPQLGPDATGVGWVMQYVLLDRSGKLNNAELRSLQDWYVRYQLTAVPGVSEIATLGGFEKQYQVVLEPERLLAYDLPVPKVLSAIRESNLDVGGRVLELGGSEYMVRGLGYLGSVEDIESVAVGVGGDGTPITVGDVARVQIGPEIRRGMADLAWQDDDGRIRQGEVTSGFVVMRFGANPLEVIERVKERMSEIQRALPEGVEIVVGYDRSDLIHRAIETLRHKLIEESLIVALVTVLFLLHARSALVAIITLPVGVLMSFLVMRWLGVNANIMSLGGIAIALGAMVDAAIVMIENMHKHMERNEHEGRPRSQWQLVADASKEVGPALFFSLLIITLSFVPIFALGAQEGRLFRPLALTKTLAMAASALLAITLVPVTMGAFIRGQIQPEERNPINRAALKIYRPTIGFVLRNRLAVIGGAVAVFLVTLIPYGRLGSEFMPPLIEGSIMDMPSVFPGVGTGQVKRMLEQRDRAMASIPEVEMVLGKAGRAETATDAAPLSMFESVAILKPEEEWREGVDYDSLVAEMDAVTRTPGVANMWSMPIKNRLDMLATGIKTPVGIKIFGPDLAILEEIGTRIEGLLPMVEGTASVFAERAIGGRYLEVDVDRDAAGRYGLSMTDVQHTIMTAVGGMNVTRTIEGRERYTVNVRYARELRSGTDAIGRVLVATPTGAQVPLGQLADIRFAGGPPMIKSENALLNSLVYVDVRGRDIGGYVEEARELLERELDLPTGYRLEWSGQFEAMERANRTLRIVVPITLAIIFLLLYINFRSVTESLIVMLSVPFALVGSVWLLWALGYDLSVAVWVGLIALAGVAAEISVILLVYLDEAYHRHEREGRLRNRAELMEAVREGAGERVRPVLMTATAITAGLLPILWGGGTGSTVMKRIAAPMVGGMVSATVLTLVVVPALYALWREWQLRSTWKELTLGDGESSEPGGRGTATGATPS
ncbi:MAG: CusA/CzcA family heavy metal efflux RND transporter [Gemmatimonadetes bacterium]|nr:CusA/CzcA family heavy metal efflux RND transporter [Gemmatimonadota bacterium]MBT8477827.1 CusA/CzcA family heavy metal efflux RND transporter [Gemmatimonadota bacterium]NNK49353.1 efflux RND transporter permease subunit [Gemmatimonadota bacterium]